MENKEKQLPTVEELHVMVLKLDEYATKVCEEAGFPWYAKFVVVEALNDVGISYLKLVDAIGMDKVHELMEILMEHEAKEAVESAEEILKEGE